MFTFRIESEIQHAYPSVLNALRSAGIAFFLKNKMGQYVFASERYSRLIGSEDIINRTDYDLFLTNVASEQKRVEDKMFTTGMNAKGEYAMVSLSGKECVLQIERSIYKEQDTAYILGVVRDVTQEKQKEQFNAYKQVFTESEMHEKVINRFSTYIFDNQEEETILQGVGKLCLELLQLEDVSIFLYNEDTDLLEQRMFMGVDNDLIYDAHQPVSLPVGEGNVGYAAMHFRTVNSPDVKRDQRHVQGVLEARSELAVPIIYRKQLIGVIDSEHSQHAFFTRAHEDLMEGIAGLLAIKCNELKNSRLIGTHQRQLEAFVEQSPVASVMLDTNFNYLVVSDAWKKTFQRTPENLIGKNHFVENPNLPIRWKKMIHRANEGEQFDIPKEFHQRRNGQREWFSAKIGPWRTTDGEIGGVIIHAQVITDQVRLQEEDRSVDQIQQARKMGKLFTWDFDPKTGQFHWESGDLTKELIDLGEDEHINSLFDLIEPEYKADFNSALYEAIRLKEDFEFVHPIRLKDKRRWVHTRGKVALNKEEITRIYGSAQDITEQVLTEESLQERNQELKKINDELDQFVYKTAHDMRTPLTNLLGLIDIMKDETNPDLLKTYFELQRKSVERMDQFIHKITDHTKNTRLPVREERIDFNKILDSIFRDYLYYDKSECIVKNVQIKQDCEVYSDPERVQNILNNLIANSIKFADLNKEEPRMDLDVRTKGGDVHIRLSDNGIGMTDQVKEKAFDMFYRGHGSADGAGIGLYIVKETVQKLNGKISLHSIHEKGTSVEIILPNLNPKTYTDDLPR